MGKLLKQLYQMITLEYEAYMAGIRNLDRESILEKVQEITTMQDIYQFMKSEASLDSHEIKYLLSLQNPLAVLCVQWLHAEKDISEGLNHVLWNVCDKEMGKEQEVETEISQEEFKQKLSAVIPQPSKDKTNQWFTFCNELDEIYSDWKKGVSGLSLAIEGLCAGFSNVRGKYGDKITQSLYDAIQYTALLPSELEKAAQYLQDGGDIQSISQKAMAGGFEDGDFPESEEDEYER